MMEGKEREKRERGGDKCFDFWSWRILDMLLGVESMLIKCMCLKHLSESLYRNATDDLFTFLFPIQPIRIKTI
jgi:hypothetical protein